VTALAAPTLDRYDSWAAAVREFDGAHIDGSTIPDDEAADDSRGACCRLVERARCEADTAVPPLPGRVHADAYWIVDGEEVVGFLQLRHRLNDFLAEVGGHVGYAVRPSRRREGHASRALGLALDRARELGLDRVLVTCDDDNVASAGVIEGQGGVLEDVRDGAAYGCGPKRRYWIELG